MPISDYASAFFFARRRRVTFKRLQCTRLRRRSFPKRFLKRAGCAFTVPQEHWLLLPVAIRKSAEEFWSTRKYRAKNKSPALPGFCSLSFRLAYFASLAI
jgi:hypothetical protein